MQVQRSMDLEDVQATVLRIEEHTQRAAYLLTKTKTREGELGVDTLELVTQALGHVVFALDRISGLLLAEVFEHCSICRRHHPRWKGDEPYHACE